MLTVQYGEKGTNNWFNRNAGSSSFKIFRPKKEFQVFDIAYRKKSPESILCDVSNEILEELIQKIDPKYIINCGILTREAEESPFRAIKLNSLLPHFQMKLHSNQI